MRKYGETVCDTARSIKEILGAAVECRTTKEIVFTHHTVYWNRIVLKYGAVRWKADIKSVRFLHLTSRPLLVGHMQTKSHTCWTHRDEIAHLTHTPVFLKQNRYKSQYELTETKFDLQ